MDIKDVKLIPEKYKKKEKAAPGFKAPVAGFSRLLKRFSSKANLWSILSISLLGTVILVSFGLWGYQNSLIEEKESLIKQKQDLQSQRNPGLENNFIELKKGIENFKKILKGHIYSSRLFKMLEELTLAQVQFTDLRVDFSQAKLDLKTEAVDYQTLAKQLFIFGEDARVKKAELSTVQLGTSGQVGANLELELDPDFLFYE